MNELQQRTILLTELEEIYSQKNILIICNSKNIKNLMKKILIFKGDSCITYPGKLYVY